MRAAIKCRGPLLSLCRSAIHTSQSRPNLLSLQYDICRERLHIVDSNKNTINSTVKFTDRWAFYRARGTCPMDAKS